MDDFLFHETDTFAFPLLDFDPDSALLTSAELVMHQTHLQQTQQIVPGSDSGLGQISNSSRNNSQQPTSRMSTDGGSTDTEMSIPPPASVEQQKQHSEMGAASSRMSTLLGFSTAAHSPLPSEQKLLAPRTSSTKSSVNATTPTNEESRERQQEPPETQSIADDNKNYGAQEKEQELQTIIAGLRAENKSLLDQNTFLRSLVTSFKHESASSPSSHQMTAAFASLPPPVEQSCVALNMMESGQKMEVDGDLQTEDTDLTMTPPGKRRAVTSTLSTASLAVCASVFRITIFADFDGCR
ncbi:uncharacterized protein PITG_13192 [Phytophthora infestans T30-4]|uniref:BZIP domain-containing protein n=2 Tax=Phytophthora infestans TaxID=4787 RepID=D0NLF0_PHYIT|nr:uncharacterized protein PITG_13192 [Phytophthora infestans T30-4]EEY60497.1 conserved hypothetical protein [Phytophthora infestans T30-4]|eukprot:XP_002899870.1 conserved hypothetical protein [Phytophthora infestans T30-4]